MSLTTHIGYGPFRLSDFLPGELFARLCNALHKRAYVAPPVMLP